MDEQRFDRLTLALSQRLHRHRLTDRVSRRTLLGPAFAGMLAALERSAAEGKKKKKGKKKGKGGKGTRPVPARVVKTHTFVGKSFIGPISLEHPRSAQMLAMSGLFGVDDTAIGDGKIPANSLGYRMRTFMATTTVCEGSSPITSNIDASDFHMGYENLQVGWVQGEATFREALRVQDTRCVTYTAEIRGVPHTLAIEGACVAVGYERRTIAHIVKAKVCCDRSAPEVSITGTAFPSHRVWVDGDERQTVVQGPLERLMQINNPDWRPKSDAEFGVWVGLARFTPAVCARQCFDTGNRTGRRMKSASSDEDICPAGDCPSEATCRDGSCTPIGGCCLCDDGSCRPADGCCAEEVRVTLDNDHYRCDPKEDSPPLCDLGATYCGDGTACPTGYECNDGAFPVCENGCIPMGSTLCGEYLCPSGSQCCNNVCIPPGYTCCGDSYCDEGQKCCSQGCVDKSRTCCQGEPWCVHELPDPVYPPPAPVCQSRTTCTERVCRQADETCQVFSGGSTCCAGLSCLDGACTCAAEGEACGPGSEPFCCGGLNCWENTCQAICGVDPNVCDAGHDCCVSPSAPEVSGCCSEPAFLQCCPNTLNSSGTVGACCDVGSDCCDSYCCPAGSVCCSAPDFCCAQDQDGTARRRTSQAIAPLEARSPTTSRNRSARQSSSNEHGEHAPKRNRKRSAARERKRHEKNHQRQKRIL